MPIRSFIQPGALDPEAIAAMSKAFEAALKELQDTGQRTVARDVIAGRIIAAARIGERDPVRLRAARLLGCQRHAGLGSLPRPRCRCCRRAHWPPWARVRSETKFRRVYLIGPHLRRPRPAAPYLSLARGDRSEDQGSGLAIFKVRQRILLQFHYSDAYRGFGQVCGPNQKELK
jgi:hypothetical protein